MAPRPAAIGRRAPLSPPTDDLRDPRPESFAGTKPIVGGKVPPSDKDRCQRCGMPERKRAKLYEGLWVYLRFSVTLRLCGECIPELMPSRQALDPLTLDDVA